MTVYVYQELCAMTDYPVSRQPLILRFHRLIEAFSKSDDERDFFLDKVEGFLLFIDLEKNQEELSMVEDEIKAHPERYSMIPKFTYYETKKFMEGFVNEKVYDIDTKEKLLDIIGSSDARENFLEFILDHLSELEKWQQYYSDRSRIRIIEFLRDNDFRFVFEEDIDLPKQTVEKLKLNVFEAKVPKDIQKARDHIDAKSKTYYSPDALNPRPKRGRPPKKQQVEEFVVDFTTDLYQTVPKACRYFLFMPEFMAQSISFSTKFETEDEILASLKGSTKVKSDSKLEALSQRLESLRLLSSRLKGVKEEGVIDQSLKGIIQNMPEEPLSISAEAVQSGSGGKLSSLAKRISGSPAESEEKRRKRREVSKIQYKTKSKKTK
jgi:hypothetical protein